MSQASTTNPQARGWTQALERAADGGDARLVGELLAAGATADVRLAGGATPLMRAAARGFADVARALLDAGADANARRADGFTPLILAVFFGHEEVVRLLVERGADAEVATDLGVSARGWADARGFKSIGEILRQPPAPPRPAPAPPRPRVAVTITRPGGEVVELDGVAARPDGVRPPAEVEPRTVERADAHGPAPADAPGEPQFSTPARGFARSWQASVGLMLVVAACGVGAFAWWQQSRGVGDAPPGDAAPQAARPLPAAPVSDPAAQPTPTPYVDPLSAAPPPVMPGVVIVPSDPAAQPVLVTPEAPGPASPASPSVVTDSGPEPAAGGPTPRRDARDPRGEATPPAGRPEDVRRPDEEPRAADPVRRDLETPPPPRAPDPQPAPSATPRRRVIQWPPQSK